MSEAKPIHGDQQLHEQLVVPPKPVPPRPWQEANYSAARYARIGFGLGALAGCASLLFNIIGSTLWPAISGVAQHPLRLIQVYLTFPLGDTALHQETGVLLALGCVLFLITGMIYGMLFEVALSWFLPRPGLGLRLAVFSVLSLVVWVINFYGVLLWLQPLLFGDRWIIDLIPWWVAAATHLVFGWAMALVYPLGNRAGPHEPALGSPAS